jgi:hypothetical protein
MARRPVTVNDLLDGQVGLDLECADRVYLNGYVPNLQVPGQVVLFLTRHLGNPIPSPALMDRIGQRFRRAVDSYAEANAIPVVRFVKGQRKVDVMAPLMARAAATGRSQVVAVGLAQEYAWVATAVTTHTESGYPHFTFGSAQRRVSCVYFLPVGRRHGRGVHQGLHLLPVPDEDLGQRPVCRDRRYAALSAAAAASASTAATG